MANSEKPPAWWDENRHLQPRSIPVKYSERLGKQTAARVPWESAPIAKNEGAKRSTALRVGNARSQSKASNITLSDTGTAEVGDPLPRFSARDVKASSSWMRQRPLREQVTVIRALAPFALESVDQLVVAIEQERLNDPAAQDALNALRELHGIIGELIERAESSRSMKRLWKRLEVAKEKFTAALWDGAQVILVAPTLAMGTATFLSLLSGFPISEGMITALCAASMTKDALLTVAKRR